jgi:hypothetical protein
MDPPHVVSMPTRATSPPALDSRYRRDPLWKVRTLTMGSVFNVTEALCDNLPLVATTVIENMPTAADGDTENVRD